MCKLTVHFYYLFAISKHFMFYWHIFLLSQIHSHAFLEGGFRAVLCCTSFYFIAQVTSLLNDVQKQRNLKYFLCELYIVEVRLGMGMDNNNSLDSDESGNCLELQKKLMSFWRWNLFFLSWHLRYRIIFLCLKFCLISPRLLLMTNELLDITNREPKSTIIDKKYGSQSRQCKWTMEKSRDFIPYSQTHVMAVNKQRINANSLFYKFAHLRRDGREAENQLHMLSILPKFVM